MSLEAASESRKARLLALRKRKTEQEGDGAADGDSSAPAIVKFRNYDPTTGEARKREKTDAEEDTVERAVEGLAEKIIAEDEARRKEELDLFNIAPKKPNWDLKRDLGKKLARLDRANESAIHTLIRQRLGGSAEPQVENLAAAVKASGEAADEDEDEDDA